MARAAVAGRSRPIGLPPESPHSDLPLSHAFTRPALPSRSAPLSPPPPPPLCSRRRNSNDSHRSQTAAAAAPPTPVAFATYPHTRLGRTNHDSVCHSFLVVCKGPTSSQVARPTILLIGRSSSSSRSMTFSLVAPSNNFKDPEARGRWGRKEDDCHIASPTRRLGVRSLKQPGSSSKHVCFRVSDMSADALCTKDCRTRKRLASDSVSRQSFV